MAIIQSYPINDNIKDTDLLLGVTNIAPSGNPIYQTKSFRIGDIAASVPTIAASYGQLYLPSTQSVITIIEAGVWQKIGLIATLSEPSYGFSLGTTDKCALKNVSGSTKTVNVSGNVFVGIGSAFEYDNVALALNGNVIEGTKGSTGYGWNTDWVVEMQDGDEISTYIRSQFTGNGTFYELRMSVTQL
jgi:hypothetical protein